MTIDLEIMLCYYLDSEWNIHRLSATAYWQVHLKQEKRSEQKVLKEHWHFVKCVYFSPESDKRTGIIFIVHIQLLYF